MLVLTLQSYTRFHPHDIFKCRDRFAVKVHRIDERLHRKALKLGNKAKLCESRGSTVERANLEGGQIYFPR